MVYEIIISVLFLFIFIIFYSYNSLLSTFSNWSRYNFFHDKEYVKLIKNSNNFNLSNYESFWTKILKSQDIDFVRNWNKVNFLSLDIEEIKWWFTIYLEWNDNYRQQILWMVCKDNQNSSDVEFPNLINKISLTETHWIVDLSNPNLYYKDMKCFYIQLDWSEITTNSIHDRPNLWKQIKFITNWNTYKNLSIILYFQKFKIDTLDEIYWTWNNNETYYEWTQYIIKKNNTQNDILKLRNFLVIEWKNNFSLNNNSLKTITFQSPVIFYTR